METIWPNEVRLRMIEKSEFYPESEAVYKYGYYDGFQKAIEHLKSNPQIINELLNQES